MIFPMGLLIFPALMIVLLTPAALRLMGSLKYFYVKRQTGRVPDISSQSMAMG